MFLLVAKVKVRKSPSVIVLNNRSTGKMVLWVLRSAVSPFQNKTHELLSQRHNNFPVAFIPFKFSGFRSLFELLSVISQNSRARGEIVWIF